MRVERDLATWQKIYGQDNRSYPRKLASKIVTRVLSHNSRSIAAFADGHIVSAGQCRDFLHETMRVPKERIAVIPQAPPSVFSERRVPAMTEERLARILYVGQYAFCKAPVIVAAVINRLLEENEQLRFTWVCGREHHERVRGLLGTRAKGRVDLLHWMPQDELIEVYDRHSLFLFPSFVEGFGKVFLEAMSRGLCVVAADNSGARDVISHGENGMLAPTGCADTMVSHCLRLIKSVGLASGMSKSAAECAQSYTWERVAKETVSFYNDRLNARLQELQTARRYL